MIRKVYGLIKRTRATGKEMRIFIDADACPVAVKEILFRSAERLSIPLVLIANQKINFPQSDYISGIVVEAGPDIADDRIAELAEEGDLVITADIPLADRVISKRAHAINPRGEIYSAENIKERLAVRDLMADLRDGGMETGGPRAFSAADRKAFADQLDRFLTKNLR